MVGALTRLQMIVLLLIATVVIAMSFGPVPAIVGPPLLDFIFNGEAARARLAELSTYQRQVHLYGTLINDTLFPLAYSGLLAGVAGRFASLRWRGWVMLPALAACVLDLCENAVQVLALSGTVDLLDLKTVLTPLKFGMAGVAIVLAIGLLGMGIVRRLSGRAVAP